MLRTENTILSFCETLGLDYTQISSSPLLRNMRYLSDLERSEVFNSQIQRYSVNTIKSHSHKCKKFFEFCYLRTENTFPVNESILNLFLISLGKEGKSIGFIKSLISSLDFVCKIFGYKTVGCNNSVKNTFKYLEKLCHRVTKPRNPFSLEIINKLCKNIDKNGGTKNLSFIQHRTFIMIISCYYSIMRFDDVQDQKVSDIQKKKDYYKFSINSSKTDQSGKGQVAYVVSTKQKHDPFMLITEYLKKLETLGSSYFLPAMVYCKKSKKYVLSEKSLSYSTAYSGFKKFLSDFSIESKYLSLHSLRIGGTTDDFKYKLDHRIIDKKGRWKNSETKFIYCKDADNEIVKEIKKSNKKRNFQ